MQRHDRRHLLPAVPYVVKRARSYSAANVAASLIHSSTCASVGAW